MSDQRNSFSSAHRTHALLRALVNGERLTIKRVQHVCDVAYPQARAYLKLLERIYDLHTWRDGRTKVWSWPYEEGEFPLMNEEEMDV